MTSLIACRGISEPVVRGEQHAVDPGVEEEGALWQIARGVPEELDALSFQPFEVSAQTGCDPFAPLTVDGDVLSIQPSR